MNKGVTLIPPFIIKASLETDSFIPADTGFHHHREAEFEFTVEEPEPIIIPKETFDDEEDAATA